MMIPIPARACCEACRGAGGGAGRARHRGASTITTPLRAPVVPLPEGDELPGLHLRARRAPDEVEAALREAHRRLRFQIDPCIALLIEN